MTRRGLPVPWRLGILVVGVSVIALLVIGRVIA